MASKPPFPPKPGMPDLGRFPGIPTPGIPGASALNTLAPTGPQWRAGSWGAGNLQQRQNEIAALVRAAGLGKDALDDILKLLSDGQVTWLKRYKDGAGSVQDLKYIIDFYAYLRKTTMSASDIAKFFTVVERTGISNQLDLIRKLVSVTPKLDKFFRVLGHTAKPLDGLLLYMTLNQHAAKGEWNLVIVETYKFAAGKAVPWAGFVDALQSLLESFVPDTAKASYVFRVIRSLDLVGLSGAGVDAIIYVATGIVRWNKPFDEDRLNKLAARLKTGPTAIFYEFGEKIPIGEVLYDLTEMTTNAWNKLGQMSLSDLHSTLRSWPRAGGMLR